MSTGRTIAAIAATMTLCGLATIALASRNAAGTMVGISGPYVSGTTISSSVINARLADIETEITSSADRSGRGGFLAAVRGIDGTVSAPAFSWTSETGSGLFRNGTNDVRMSIGGSAKEFWSASNGVGVGGAPPSAAGASGSLSIMNGANQSFLFMQDTRGAAGNQLGRIIYDGSSLSGGTGNLAKPGWVFQAVGDTGAFVSSGVTVFRDGTLQIGGGTTLGTYRMKAGTAGCATAAAAGATCDTTVTWPTAFADANYNAWCVAGGTVTSGVPVVQILNSYLAATVNVRTVAVTAAAAQFGSFDCFAFHQ